MLPQVPAVTPVAQATLQVMLTLLDPETKAKNNRVVLVITLAVAGWTELIVTVVAVLPP
jgi:hypothetical protein